MIVGDNIIAAGLVVGGTSNNLKHSTYDLTIGQIIPIGKAGVKARKRSPPQDYFIEPREMVWVLSSEEFRMPSNTTGLATLRTSMTKDGILALNVGIIDPMFSGPISTALINFSDRPRRIEVGQKFFRVIFFEHANVAAYHPGDESTESEAYLKTLEKVSYSDFSKSFLNIPNYDDDFYKKRLLNIVWTGVAKTGWGQLLIIYITVTQIYLFHIGFFDYLISWMTWAHAIYDKIKPI